MKNLTDQLLKIKRNVEQMKQDRDKARGALSQVMKQIQTEFKCKDLNEAEKLLSKMQKQWKQDKEQLEKDTVALEQELEKHES